MDGHGPDGRPLDGGVVSSGPGTASTTVGTVQPGQTVTVVIRVLVGRGPSVRLGAVVSRLVL